MIPPQVMERARLLGILLTAGGAVLFSVKAIVIKLSYRYGIDTVSLLALRMALAVPAYLLIAGLLTWAQPAPSLSRRQWLQILGLGLCGYYLASYLDLAGLQFVSAGLERLVLYVYPTLVLLYGRLFFGRRVQPAELVAVAICYLGLAVVFAEDLRLYEDDVLIGGLLVFGSAAAYALFMTGSGRLIPRVGSVRFTCYAMTAAGLGIAAHFLLTQPADLLALPAPVYGLGAFLAIACTTIPSFMTAAGVGRIGAERAALIGMVGPASTLVLGHLILDEPVTLVHLLGSALILGGVIYISLHKAPAVAPGRAQ